jgi:HSP90 family molecular chaperone
MAVHFSVDTKLTKLLGETYRSSEIALKELVDNAWDADARSVRISLPEPLSGDSVIVQNDGTGMTAKELSSEYLNIASDKRSRIGKETPSLKRRVKGRKGIGKFAGLTIAGLMQIKTVARGKKCTLVIDKKELNDNEADLEKVPLSLEEEAAKAGEVGTIITLSLLDSNLNFPCPCRKLNPVGISRELGAAVRNVGPPQIAIWSCRRSTSIAGGVGSRNHRTSAADHGSASR